VTARTTQRIRTNEWKSSTVASSATTFSISTDDPSLSVVMAPMPMLTLDFGGKSGFRHGAARAAFPQRLPDPPHPPSTSDRPLDPPRPEHIPPEELPPPEPRAAPAEPELDAEAHPHRIEMTIDSLANHMLTEPIPITIDPLGEAAFTAAVRNVEIVATGNSISEALVLLKEQIEFIYDDLNRQSDHSAEQKTMLQILHTYISPRSTKPEWL
jgi:hypothetical protein